MTQINVFYNWPFKYINFCKFILIGALSISSEVLRVSNLFNLSYLLLGPAYFPLHHVKFFEHVLVCDVPETEV
jgi:hypothetical protein